MGLNFAFDNLTNKIDLTYDDDGMRQCFEQALTTCRVFYNRTDAKRIAAGNNQRNALSNSDEVIRRQERIREKFWECVGGLPSSESLLAVRNVGVIHRNAFDLEKIVFQSRLRGRTVQSLALGAGHRTARSIDCSGVYSGRQLARRLERHHLSDIYRKTTGE